MRAVTVGLVVCGLCAGASAEQNRFNVRLQTGVLITADQPAVAMNIDGFVKTGMQLRGALEYEIHERIGVELGYGANLMFHNVDSSVGAQQLIVAGVRVRPWWSKQPGYILPQPTLPKDRHKLTIHDLISDAWVDAHAMLAFSDTTRFGYDVGIGARAAIYSPLQVGLFVRWQHLVTGGDPSFKQIVIGLELSAGFLPVHSQPDDDGDGVPNAEDRCPDTEHGVRVNRAGCPFSQSSTPAPRCSDTDLDGVCDGQDECPDTKAGLAVDSRGCPSGGAAVPQE